MKEFNIVFCNNVEVDWIREALVNGRVSTIKEVKTRNISKATCDTVFIRKNAESPILVEFKLHWIEKYPTIEMGGVHIPLFKLWFLVYKYSKTTEVIVEEIED